ncbi:MAG: hypothetical protein MJD61_16230 [Proteobacteria bacterium]|nr:hypothetical protein [Pseudomonadota bacterium]
MWGIVLGAVIGCLPAAGPALAQATFPVLLTAVGDRTGTTFNLSNNPINAHECRDNIVLTFWLQELPQTAPRIEIWSGIDCVEEARRNPTVNQMPCTPIQTVDRGNQMQIPDVQIRVQDGASPLGGGAGAPGAGSVGGAGGGAAGAGGMAGAAGAGAAGFSGRMHDGVGEDPGGPTPRRDSPGAPALGLPCDNLSEKRIYWFIALKTTGGPAEASAQFEVTFDTIAPDAPQGVTAGRGQSQIPISWQLVDDTNKYRIYYDVNIDTACVSTLFSEGVDPLTLSPEVSFKEVNSPLATSSTLDNVVPLFGTAAVAVSAVDRAGNHSPLSNVACAMGVPTDGFWDIYRDRIGHTPDEGCSVLGGAPGAGSQAGRLPWSGCAWGLTLLLVPLLVLRRSARARRSGP